MTATINASTSAGVVTTADTSGILQLQTNGTAALTVDASQNVGIGTSSPTNKLHVSSSSFETIKLQGTSTVSGINFVNSASSNGYIYYDNGPNMLFYTNNSERARIDSSGNVGIGTSSPSAKLHVVSSSGENKIISEATAASQQASISLIVQAATPGQTVIYMGKTGATTNGQLGYDPNTNAMTLYTNNSERARIDSSGSLLVGKTASSFGTAGVEINAGGGNFCRFTRDGGSLADFNRLSNDGELIGFWQATTQEGSISVSGTTVSYNGGHLSRWAQTTAPKDDTLVKGTVLSNLDEMNVYTDADGNPIDNEQLNKVKVSDVEGDANVAGVFVNWTHDDAHDVDEINMAMTGDMIIRIAQGTTVARGDLLMSAGDGTAKPQGDDIVRSKTVAKVTSTHVTCTYADGSFCVPCVLMAC